MRLAPYNYDHICVVGCCKINHISLVRRSMILKGIASYIANQTLLEYSKLTVDVIYERASTEVLQCKMVL